MALPFAIANANAHPFAIVNAYAFTPVYTYVYTGGLP